LSWNLDEKPLLVFWETTRACDLACRHCRASAIPQALEGELDHREGLALLDQVATFGRPSPILVMTGGDVLKRAGFWELLEQARARGIPVALSPAVTPLLTDQVLERLAAQGVSAVSLSLDGSAAVFHDGLRGVPGTFQRTLECARRAVEYGLKLQINSTVMAENVQQLPALFQLIHGLGAHVWEAFFLIATGRGTELSAPSPEQCEAACWLLNEAAGYGLTVRTVEGPFFRRVVHQAAAGKPLDPGDPARHLIEDLHGRLGPPTHPARSRSARTRDGRGLIFVDYQGRVSPSGFLPLVAGNVRERSLVEIYRDSSLFRNLRDAGSLGGRCGRCGYRDLCGGSRSRAYAASGDCLAEDPACVYQPQGTEPLLA
jgi:radical SAM protein